MVEAAELTNLVTLPHGLKLQHDRHQMQHTCCDVQEGFHYRRILSCPPGAADAWYYSNPGGFLQSAVLDYAE